MVYMNCALKIASLHSNESEKPDELEKHPCSVKRGLLGKELDSKSHANERGKVQDNITQKAYPFAFSRETRFGIGDIKLVGYRKRHTQPRPHLIKVAKFRISC